MKKQEILYANCITTRVKNKRVSTFDLHDGTYFIEIFRHVGNDEPRIESDEDHFLTKKVLRGKVLYGGIRLSKESLEILQRQIAIILNLEEVQEQLKTK